MYKQELNGRRLPQSLSTLFFETGFPMEPEARRAGHCAMSDL